MPTGATGSYGLNFTNRQLSGGLTDHIVTRSFWISIFEPPLGPCTGLSNDRLRSLQLRASTTLKRACLVGWHITHPAGAWARGCHAAPNPRSWLVGHGVRKLVRGAQTHGTAGCQLLNGAYEVLLGTKTWESDCGRRTSSTVHTPAVVNEEETPESRPTRDPQMDLSAD